MIYQYQWREGARVPAPAQVVGERLEAIRAAHDGDLTPDAVVDDARAADSPLHPCFEWNDSAAAEEWRREQAKYLIRHIEVQIQPAPNLEPRVVRAFVSVTRNDEQAYTGIETAMADAALRQQVVGRAWSELQQWRRRYDAYQELAAVFSVIDAHRPASV